MDIYIQKDGQQHGPFSLDEVNSKALNGEFSSSDPAWIEGWEEWQPLSCLPGFVSRPAAPPPFKPQGSPPATKASAMFLYIPTGRLVAMSIVSLGVYDAYWIYRNWRYLKERDGLKIEPFWRGVFGIFFLQPLLKAIKTDAATNQIRPATFSPGGLATGWIIMRFLGGALDRDADPVVNLVGIIISAAAFCFLLPAQKHINALNEGSPVRPAYYGWSRGHIVCLVFGIILWLLILVGLTQHTPGGSAPAIVTEPRPPSQRPRPTAETEGDNESQRKRAYSPEDVGSQMIETEGDKEFQRLRAKSKAEAIALYPDVADVKTPLGKEVARLIESYKNTNDPILYAPDAPMIVTLAAAKNLGVAPATKKKTP